MKIKNIIFLLLEAIAILACIAVIYFVSVAQVEPVEVFRFTKHLTANTIIKAGDFEVVEIPASAVTSNFVTKKDDLIGKGIKSDVYPGEYVLSVQLSEPEDLDPFKDMDFTDKVKVAIPVDLTQAVGGLINRGDVVDLYYTGKYENPEVNDDSHYSTRFAQEIYVYEVLNDSANIVENTVESGEIRYDAEGLPVGNVGDVEHVVVVVTPEQALEIQTRLAIGVVTIVGRFEDTETKPLQDFLLTGGSDIKATLTKVESSK